jgi:hypothetical protein
LSRAVGNPATLAAAHKRGKIAVLTGKLRGS